jgi:hypothetical protein
VGSNFPACAPAKIRDLHSYGAAWVWLEIKNWSELNFWFRDHCRPATSLEETAPNLAGYTPAGSAPHAFPAVILLKVRPGFEAAPQGLWND